MACSVSFHSARDDFGSAMNFSLPADVVEYGKMMPTPLSPRSSRVQMLKLRFAPLISKAQKILASKEDAPASSSSSSSTLMAEDRKKTPATDDDLRRITNTKKKAAASSSSSSLTMVDCKRKKLSSEGVDDERIITGCSLKKRTRRIDLRLVECKSTTAAGKATTAAPITTTATTTSPSPAAAAADGRRKIQLQRRREAERRERDQMRNTTGICDPSDLVRDLEKTLGYSITHFHNSTPLPLNLPAFLWSNLAEPPEEAEEDEDCCSHGGDGVADCVEVSGEREEGEIWDDD